MTPAALAAALRAAGVAVVEAPGWEHRAQPGTWAPIGTVWHHTASNRHAGELIPTSTDQGAATGLFGVGTPSSTAFNIVNRGATTITAGQDISWKVRAEPQTGQGGALVGPFVPWDWTRFTALGPFGNIFIQLGYEAAA